MSDSNKLTKEYIEKRNKEVLETPPFSGNIVADYSNIMQKELVRLGEVWTEYFESDPMASKNPLIINHMQTVQAMYDRLFEGLGTIVSGMSEKEEEANDSHE